MSILSKHFIFSVEIIIISIFVFLPFLIPLSDVQRDIVAVFGVGVGVLYGCHFN
jgi:hypothetical protein